MQFLEAQQGNVNSMIHYTCVFSHTHTLNTHVYDTINKFLVNKISASYVIFTFKASVIKLFYQKQFYHSSFTLSASFCFCNMHILRHLFFKQFMRYSCKIFISYRSRNGKIALNNSASVKYNAVLNSYFSLHFISIQYCKWKNVYKSDQVDVCFLNSNKKLYPYFY